MRRRANEPQPPSRPSTREKPEDISLLPARLPIRHATRSRRGVRRASAVMEGPIRSGSQSPSLLRRGMPSFLVRLSAAEKRDNLKTTPIVPSTAEQQYLDDLQLKANALFRRSLPKRMQGSFDPPPPLRPLPGKEMAHDERTLSPVSSSPPSSSRVNKSRSPIRMAAGRIAATVRTARTQRRRAVSLLSPSGAVYRKRQQYEGQRRQQQQRQQPQPPPPPQQQQQQLAVQRKLHFDDAAADDLPPSHPVSAPPPSRRGATTTARSRKQTVAPASARPRPAAAGAKKKKLVKKATTARPSATSTDPARDCVQHGYHPLGPIAAGAFSTIRHARVELGHPRLPAGREVAIKTWGVAACKKDAANAFNRDTELATLRRAALHPHPHVANLIDVLNGPLYTHGVLEYCSGGSLLRHLQRLQTSSGGHQSRILRGGHAPPALSGGMEPNQARWITRQVLSGLGFLHSLDVTHRDIKPANILFVDASRTSVKLCDFGFAVVCPPGQKLRMRCGTPIYNAPELVRGVEYYGPPVDVWALGAMLFEMLHGKAAFHGNTLAQVEQRIRNGQHLPFSSEVPAEARGLVTACLTLNPGQRATASGALLHSWLAVGAPPRAEGSSPGLAPPALSTPLAAEAPPDETPPAPAAPAAPMASTPPATPAPPAPPAPPAALAASPTASLAALVASDRPSSRRESHDTIDTRTDSESSASDASPRGDGFNRQVDAEDGKPQPTELMAKELPPFLSKHPALALQVYHYHSRVGSRTKLEPRANATPGRTVV